MNKLIRVLFVFGLLFQESLQRKKFHFKIVTADKPAPENIDKGSEDAFYTSKFAFAVADGVGAWKQQGIDASLYPKRLMETIPKIINSNPSRYYSNPRLMVISAEHYAGDVTGSSTLLVITMDNKNRELRSAHIGNSGYIILRKDLEHEPDPDAHYEVIFESQEQIHEFGLPFQLGTNGDEPGNCIEHTHHIQAGDLVIGGSDGLFDNLYADKIVSIVNRIKKTKGMKLQEMADAILEEGYKWSLDQNYHSPYAKKSMENDIDYSGGKADDITVIMALIERNYEEDNY